MAKTRLQRRNYNILKMDREEAKQMFREDKNSQGCYKAVLTKVDKIYDAFEAQHKKLLIDFFNTLYDVKTKEGKEATEKKIDCYLSNL